MAVFTGKSIPPWPTFPLRTPKAVGKIGPFGLIETDFLMIGVSPDAIQTSLRLTRTGAKGGFIFDCKSGVSVRLRYASRSHFPDPYDPSREYFNVPTLDLLRSEGAPVDLEIKYGVDFEIPPI
jgi:hypothetical protein